MKFSGQGYRSGKNILENVGQGWTEMRRANYSSTPHIARLEHQPQDGREREGEGDVEDGEIPSMTSCRRKI